MIESDLQAIEVKEGDQSISLTRPTPVYTAAPVAAPITSAPAAPAAKKHHVVRLRPLRWLAFSIQH